MTAGRPMDAEATGAMLGAILSGVPRLPDAACRDRQALFRAAEDGFTDGIQGALAICGRCPEHDACGAWVGTNHILFYIRPGYADRLSSALVIRARTAARGLRVA